MLARAPRAAIALIVCAQLLACAGTPAKGPPREVALVGAASDAGTPSFADAGGALSSARVGPPPSGDAFKSLASTTLDRSADAGPLSGEAALRASIGNAAAKSDLDALDPLLKSAEVLAPSTPDAASLWLAAAEGRRVRTESFATRAAAATLEATPGNSARELLALLSADASSCAADAHRSWALQLPSAASAIDSGKPPAEALANASLASAEPLFLDALCTAAWARAQGFTFFIEAKPLLEAELLQAKALSPRLDDAGPDRELGRLYASLPGYAGGDLGLARAHFEAAIALAPQALWNRVLFARSVAVKIQDRALFNKLLQEALASTAETASARAAQLEARSLLDRADDLFGTTVLPH